MNDTVMRILNATPLPAVLIMAVALAGCASSTVQTRNAVATAGIPKPARVYVQDFAVSPGEVKQNAGVLARLRRRVADADTTAEQRAIAREVADALATELTARIGALGLNAVRAEPDTPLAEGTILITGAFVNIDEGNRARRTVIGLGLGESSLDTTVQVLAPAPTGYRELIAFDAHTDSGAMPGAAVLGPAGIAAGAGTAAVVGTNVAIGAAKGYRSAAAQQAKQQADKIVSELAKYFAEQGWISPEKVQ